MVCWRLLVPLLFLCVACGKDPSFPMPAGLPPPGGAAELFALRLSDREGPRFSGLLALRRGEEGLYYTLLDASGLKLLDAGIDLAGRPRGVAGPLRHSSLAPLLAKALARSFLPSPAAEPCQGWLPRQCRRQGEEGWEAWGAFGPVPLWSARGGGAAGELEYRQPWLGLRLQLRSLAK